MDAVPITELTEGPGGETSAAVRARVLDARERQLARPIRARVNATLTGPELKKVAALDAAGRRLLERSAERCICQRAPFTASSALRGPSPTWRTPMPSRPSISAKRCNIDLSSGQDECAAARVCQTRLG